MAECSIEGCERLEYRFNLCRRHHYRFITHGSPTGGEPLRNTEHKGRCSIPNCEGEYLAKGLCANHYAKRRSHGDPLYQRSFSNSQPCSVRGCSELQIARGLCGRHYQRVLKHGDPETFLKGEIGKGTLDAKGYVILYRPGHPNAHKTGRIRENRLVMSEMLGRPLRADETAHHKNGIKTDNRPENLELWSSNHPPGQRVQDLVAWAREIIERYERDIATISVAGSDPSGSGG